MTKKNAKKKGKYGIMLGGNIMDGAGWTRVPRKKKEKK